jgi:hypothetical protein
MPSGFALDPGGFTEDFTGEIADLVFQPGQFGTQAIVTVALDEPITKNDGTLLNDKTLYISVGAGWNTTDGTTLVHDSGDDSKKMRADSKWGKFTERIVELGAADQIVKAGGGVYNTAGWKGLRFHFMTEGAGNPYKFSDKVTGEVKEGKTKGQAMPVEFLGTKDAPQAGSVGASTSPGFSLTDLPDEVIEAWAPIADSSANGDFMKAVMASPLFTKDALGESYGAVTKALGDGSLQSALSNF